MLKTKPAKKKLLGKFLLKGKFYQLSVLIKNFSNEEQKSSVNNY